MFVFNKNLDDPQILELWEKEKHSVYFLRTMHRFGFFYKHLSHFPFIIFFSNDNTYMVPSALSGVENGIPEAIARSVEYNNFPAPRYIADHATILECSSPNSLLNTKQNSYSYSNPLKDKLMHTVPSVQLASLKTQIYYSLMEI